MLSPAMAFDTATASSAPPAMDEDHALVRAAGQGDARAFEALYRKHSRRTYAAV
jgi:DNA-binding GntR family transcriptional regulator